MAANASDMFQKVARSTATTLSAPGYTVGATSINVASTSNWPADTGITFGIDEVDGGGNRIAGTYNIFRGTVGSATQLANLTYVGGDANRNYSAGATTRVYILVSYARENRLVDGLLVSHDQDGTLKAGAVDNATVLASNVVETAKIKDGAVTPEKLSTSPTGFGLQEIARTTLSSASDTITVSSIPTKKYLFIKAVLIPTGGNITGTLKLNNDTGTNYTIRYADNFAGGGSASLTSQSPTGWADNGTAFNVLVAEIKIANLAIYEKMAVGTIWGGNVVGAANATNIRYWSGKWTNTTDQINRVDIINFGTGDYAAGSEVVILGNN